MAKPITNEKRELIMKHMKAGERIKGVSKSLSIHEITVRRVWNKYQKAGSYEPEPLNSGRKPLVSFDTMEKVCEKIKETPDITLLELIEEFELPISQSAQMHPVIGLKAEKDSLSPLPPATIRNLYHIKTKRALVNASSMISYQGNHYSVAPEYMSKHVHIREHDGHLCIYYNKLLITIHLVSDKKLNYLQEHYVEIAKRTLPFSDDKIEEIAKENLQRIGKRYEYNNT